MLPLMTVLIIVSKKKQVNELKSGWVIAGSTQNRCPCPNNPRPYALYVLHKFNEVKCILKKLNHLYQQWVRHARASQIPHHLFEPEPTYCLASASRWIWIQNRSTSSSIAHTIFNSSRTINNNLRNYLQLLRETRFLLCFRKVLCSIFMHCAVVFLSLPSQPLRFLFMRFVPPHFVAMWKEVCVRH